MARALDKRGFVRLPANFIVKYTLQDDKTKTVKEAISRDLSPKGILLSLDRALIVSTKLNLEIICTKLHEPILVEGKVVWIEEITKNHAYRAGIIFTKVSPADLEFLQEHNQELSLNKILATAASNKASDVHLAVNHPPVMRILGNLVPIRTKRINSEEMKNLIYGSLSKQQIERFEAELELDTAYMTNFGRFRVNVHKEKGQIGANFRYITTEIRTIKDLGLPPVTEDLARKSNGLILVTGPSGNGKSTTLAAMLDLINEEKDCTIMTLEDPIEYLHQSKKSIIKQREIGYDSLTFHDGLKHLLRQDADVILVGEMRDLESMAITLLAAQTGHLVLSTLHTSDAVSSINRIIGSFPANQQNQIRIELAECLRGVISQFLIHRQDRPERIAATEALVVTPAVAHLIRQGHTEQIPTSIETGGQYGMHLMDTSLERLYKKGYISRESAITYAKNPEKFD